MEERYPYIGVRIISRLKEMQMSQVNLCRDANLSTTAMSAYCTGKRIPETSALYRISKVLNVSMEWLLMGIDATREDLPNGDLICDGSPLLEDESDLVAMFRLLDERDKSDVFDYTTLKYEKSTGKKGSVYSTYIEDKNEQQKSDSDEAINTHKGTA